MIQRFLKKELINKLEPNKVVVIYGPRQVGKTTLLKEILSGMKEEYMYLSGEDRNVRSWLSSQSIQVLTDNIGSKRLIAIDEAQKVEQIGLNLKLIVDHIPGIKVIATGSSSFELAKQVGEPLVGRKWQFTLYPIAQLELNKMEEKYQTRDKLPSRLIYGSYPAVITSEDQEKKTEILNSIVDNYLYRDLFEFEEIRKAQKILDILRLLAFQIGQEVSFHEIGTKLGLDLRTVEKYLDLLEKVFVIKRVFGFSRNLRKEITKNSRFYFFDNGIRNAIINNFNTLETRNDIGQLWENYLFMERLKKQHYLKIFTNNYFWRTYDQKEIDLVEEREGKLFGYEFKWNGGPAIAKSKTVKADRTSSPKSKFKPPKIWLETYKNAEYHVIDPENYLDFIG